MLLAYRAVKVPSFFTPVFRYTLIGLRVVVMKSS